MTRPPAARVWGDAPAAVLVLTVFSHPDPRRVGERAALPELGLGRCVEVSRGTPRFAPLGSPWDDRSLDDSYLSRKPWSIVPADEGLVLERGTSSIILHLEGALVAREGFFRAAEGGTLFAPGTSMMKSHRAHSTAS